ncbi:MAG: hypothetical protein A3B34_01740 [Candidatus Sungbacteria bacterium RIFCSPLOWO2_01_FULL_54_21]|uniref:Uncharacterized protein n=1 Tax=Candidatus Sungbacteria bacterium RIFCSPLOWO2_01_FULL_54_21 TaxID=1802279 RepID=A0A1G2LA91_9BACT|nr:MAG: hypothetical protein A3B34_01740 [Candidatus Sungbacteria bacterium RIFCSPLOWO2_01_FULL_54_21]
MSLTEQRRQEILDVLLQRISEGKGMDSSFGYRQGTRIPLPGRMGAKMRTFNLSRATGIPAEELDEFRATATEETHRCISEATAAYKRDHPNQPE